MATTGLDIVRRVYGRLRKPDERALPLQSVKSTISEKMQLYRLQLLAAAPSLQTVYSDWFTAGTRNIVLATIAPALANVAFPVKVKMRPTGAAGEDAYDIPIVDYDYLSNTPEAVSFYGDPLRIIFSDQIVISGYQFRIGFESNAGTEIDLATEIDLPHYFMSMLILEAAFDLIDQVEDNSPEWAMFVANTSAKWLAMLTEWRAEWKEFIKTYGRSWKPKA